MPLVEVVGGEKTGSAATERALAFYTAIGKQPIHIRREVPGHVANRLQAALRREALHLVAEGIASGWIPVLHRKPPPTARLRRKQPSAYAEWNWRCRPQAGNWFSGALSTWRSDRSRIEIPGADRALVRILFAIERFEGICSPTIISQ